MQEVTNNKSLGHQLLVDIVQSLEFRYHAASYAQCTYVHNQMHILCIIYRWFEAADKDCSIHLSDVQTYDGSCQTLQLLSD